MWQHANTAEDNAIFAALSAGLQPPPGFQFDQAPGFQPSYDRLCFRAPLYWAAAAGFRATDDIRRCIEAAAAGSQAFIEYDATMHRGSRRTIRLCFQPFCIVAAMS